MPKKTRKEKIIAQARRILAESHQNALHQSTDGAESMRYPAPFSYTATAVSRQISPKQIDDEKEYGAIRQDIVKTILLASAAVLIEFLLYWKLR